jgi:predicted HicB family RNase H-like nuclease
MKQERLNVTVRLTPRLREQLIVEAAKQRRSMSDLINDACSDYLTYQSDTNDQQTT